MTVSEQIIQVLDALCEKFGMAIDWTGENVIPYVATLCTKLVSYEIWTSVAWIALCAMIILTGFILIKKYKTVLLENFDSDDIGCVLGIFLIIILELWILGGRIPLKSNLI